MRLDLRDRVLYAPALNRAFTAFGFGPRLLLVHEARASGAQLHDCRRIRAGSRFERQFVRDF